MSILSWQDRVLGRLHALRDGKGHIRAGLRRTAPAETGSSAICGPGEGIRPGSTSEGSAQVCRYRYGLRTCLASRRTGRDVIWVGKTRPHSGLILTGAGCDATGGSARRCRCRVASDVKAHEERPACLQTRRTR